MIFKVFISNDEVLVFDKDGTGEDEFFADIKERDREDYDVGFCELPFVIDTAAKIRFEPYREHK